MELKIQAVSIQTNYYSLFHSCCYSPSPVCFSTDECVCFSVLVCPPVVVYPGLSVVSGSLDWAGRSVDLFPHSIIIYTQCTKILPDLQN